MKQYGAVIKVMEKNGGFATLGFLYQNVLKVPGVEWKTKTPFASIRRIVQDERFFLKIRPGLWALKSCKDKLPFDFFPKPELSERTRDEFNHSYYQGLLIEIGNLKQFGTYIPSQDKNKNFLRKKLGDISTIKEFYQFGYKYIVGKAKSVDVSWFNQRKMPNAFFEVEHSTNIQNSLLKFIELQDFSVKFFIVADKHRKKEYEDKLSLNAFRPIVTKVRFMNYDKLSEWHTRTSEIVSLENNLQL